tara:strand:+ start:6663 stop:7244 length:582 start_codon:yes stop_codon:yes gene_type:complete
MKILKFLILSSAPLIFTQNIFAGITIGQELAELKAKMAKLETKVDKKLGPGIPTSNIDAYLTTGDCTALSTQPTNACTPANFCYGTADFNSAAPPTNLLGYTFTATKTTADAPDKDGGIWLCDAIDISASVVSQCTSIGGNRRDGTNTVEFTIPVGAATKNIYALSMDASGFNSVSDISSFAVCKTKSTPITP